MMNFVDLAILNRLGADLIQLSPLLVLVITATFILVIEALFPSDEALYTSLLSLWGIAMSAVAACSQWQAPAGALFGGMLVVDRFTLFVEFLILAIGGITIVLSTRFIRTSRLPSAEYSFFVLLSMAGMMLLSSSADLLMLFLSIETMSLALYVLVSYQVRDRLANEGAMKYLILGGFASGFLLYGIALMFGATGTTQVGEIGRQLLILEKTNGLFWLSLLFLFVGLAFKIAAVPFHMWVPDVYEGSPTPIAAFMAAGVKISAFSALLRVTFVGLSSLKAEWTEAVWWIAVLTMTLGNLAAIRQTNLKRMLAYSSIAHTGYLLMALVAAEGAESASAISSA
ncbi:MAG: NADH-quinone oxidoreductase subunit N, partial [Deltaproteobacteria bacterium]|nr:NADH-quinone oxidoreductase subunit N [Deltaproteobacteria bacterium]